MTGGIDNSNSQKKRTYVAAQSRLEQILATINDDHIHFKTGKHKFPSDNYKLVFPVVQLTVRMLLMLDFALRVSTSRSNCCFQLVSSASS
jgi:hypothetical protein